MHNARITSFPAQFPYPPRSLAWDGDDLVDWVGGGRRWRAGGGESAPARRYAFDFDRALISPSGRYSVIYAERGTKGLVLDRGEILRELDRSYYQASAYAYPIALGRLPDGREVIAHCPDEYNILQIETLAEGKRLTRRRGKAEDIFHSRLSFSPDGRHLLSAGWLWHPLNVACIFDTGLALEKPKSLDTFDMSPGTVFEGSDIHMASEAMGVCWLDSERIVVTTSIEDSEDAPGNPLWGHSGIWSVRDQAFQARRKDWNPQGSLQACAGGMLYVEDGCPHWWSPDAGAPISWPDIAVLHPREDVKRSGIVFDSPLLAAHPVAPRFAAVTESGIVVVERA